MTNGHCRTSLHSKFIRHTARDDWFPVKQPAIAADITQFKMIEYHRLICALG